MGMKNQKAFAVSELKTVGEAGSGQFEALVSVFDNIDYVNDRVKTTAFDRAVKEQEPPPVVWSHFWNIPPIGETLDWGPRTTAGKSGLGVKGQLFVGADDNHMYADMTYAAMKSRDGRLPALREFSFQYDIPEGGRKDVTETVDGKTTVIHELHELFPINEVGPCLKGCNPATEMLVPPKSADVNIERLRELDEDAFKAAQRFLQRKASGDIESYPISLLLAMLDDATSYIATEKDSEDVAAMRRLARSLLDLLNKDFADAGLKSQDGAVQPKSYPAGYAELLLLSP